MIDEIRERFRSTPTVYYAMSITASWAGVGSLMNFRTLAHTNGMVPAIIWGAANSIACALFGLVAWKLPTVRELMRTRVLKICLAFLAIFQTWLNMNGIREIFGDTPIGEEGGTLIAYAVCVFFILLLLKQGMIRNVLTDSASWVAVYGLLFLLVVLAYMSNGLNIGGMSLGLDPVNMKVGIWKGILLLPGPFTFAYFFEILDYNDRNEDRVSKVDITRAFVMAGSMFGWYMLFAATLALVEFTPAQNVIKAILITIVAISSVSSFLYSEYLLLGRKIGLLVDVATVVLWRLVIPMGVMGVWTLMSEIRIYLVAALLVAAVIKKHIAGEKETTYDSV